MRALAATNEVGRDWRVLCRNRMWSPRGEGEHPRDQLGSGYHAPAELLVTHTRSEAAG